MTPVKEHVANGPLTDALAGIIGYLRVRRYGRVMGNLEEVFLGACDRFIGVLAEHLKYEEEELFPELRRLAPLSGPALEAVAREHGLLRIYAQELAARLKIRDEEGASEVARAFLAALLDHIEHENRAVDGAVASLDPGRRRELEERIDLQD